MGESALGLVIVVIVILLVAALVMVWLVYRVPKNCTRCRIKPICSGASLEKCEASFDTMFQLDTKLGECGIEYKKRYGGKTAEYMLKEHPDRSFSYMKRSIYLVLKKPSGETFDENTLVYVGLHELGHVLCAKMDGDEHGPEYQLVFSRLLSIAQEKGYYDPAKGMDDTYPHS